MNGVPAQWRAGVAVISLSILVACTVPSQDDRPVDLVLASDGLRHGPSGQQVDFGRAEVGAVAAISRILGAKPYVRVPVTGCGVLYSWAVGLEAVFRDGNFVGWRAEPGRFGTVGLGADRGSAGRVCG